MPGRCWADGNAHRSAIWSTQKFQGAREFL
jgi:hypothetical protein